MHALRLPSRPYPPRRRRTCLGGAAGSLGGVRATAPMSLPGLTRQAIDGSYTPQPMVLDARIESGHDTVGVEALFMTRDYLPGARYRGAMSRAKADLALGGLRPPLATRQAQGEVLMPSLSKHGDRDALACLEDLQP